MNVCLRVRWRTARGPALRQVVSKCSTVAEMDHRLATIDMVRKRGELLCPFGGAGSPSNIMWPGRGLPPYQVAFCSIQPFSHNKHGPKIEGLSPFLRGQPRWPSNTMWLRPRPISMPSFILIHPTVWLQYTNVTDRQAGQTTGAIA